MTARGMTVIERGGQRIGKLVVLSRGPNKAEKGVTRAHWFCQCDCGNQILVSAKSLSTAFRQQRGGTRSCGCLLGKKTKHGKHLNSIYRIWAAMKQRCLNPKNPAYQSYGARGITVCEAWKKFENFYADMGEKPPNMSMDRIDNSKGYFKENCRWASRVDQANNRTTNVFLIHDGKRRTIAQWAAEMKISEQCIRSRLASGWSLDKTLSTASARRTNLT